MHFQRMMIGMTQTGVNYLFRAVDKNAIQYEVGPEQRPLTLDVLEQLQLCRLVIQSVWILEKKRKERTICCWALFLNYLNVCKCRI